MHLCKACIFIEVNRDKECYWCILKNLELTNYSNIETCNYYMVELKDRKYEKEYKVRSNRSAEDSGWGIRRNNLRKM